jgi:thioredoxin 1
MPEQVSTKEFKNKVLINPLPCIVYFKAEWSGTSQITEPAFTELSNTYKRLINFFTADIDKEKELKEMYGIMEIPTILFFIKGEVTDYMSGLFSKNQMVAKIENIINTNTN